MKNVFNYTVIMLVAVIIINQPVIAQRFDNLYWAADADMLQVQGDSRTEHIVKGATIILPNSSNQLNVEINLPFAVAGIKQPADSGFFSHGLLFNLKVDIDRTEIQDKLTSSKTFFTKGFLTLNSITRSVAVSYMPMPAGTEQEGDFNIYLVVQFNAADFNLAAPDRHAQFFIRINDAKVNRV